MYNRVYASLFLNSIIYNRFRKNFREKKSDRMLIGSSRRVVEPAPLEIPRETARIWRETHAIACNVRPPLGVNIDPLDYWVTRPRPRQDASSTRFSILTFWMGNGSISTIFDRGSRYLNLESKFPIFPRFYWSSELIDYRRQYLNNKIIIGCFLNPRLD